MRTNPSVRVQQISAVRKCGSANRSPFQRFGKRKVQQTSTWWIRLSERFPKARRCPSAQGL